VRPHFVVSANAPLISASGVSTSATACVCVLIRAASPEPQSRPRPSHSLCLLIRMLFSTTLTLGIAIALVATTQRDAALPGTESMGLVRSLKRRHAETKGHWSMRGTTNDEKILLPRYLQRRRTVDATNRGVSPIFVVAGNSETPAAARCCCRSPTLLEHVPPSRFTWREHDRSLCHRRLSQMPMTPATLIEGTEQSCLIGPQVWCNSFQRVFIHV